MDSPSPELLALILDDKNGNTYSGVPDANGRYDAGGVEFPKAAIGQGAVIFFERDGGGYDVLCSQRSLKMRVHPGRWGIVGGYLEVKKGESPLEGIWREVFEETNDVVDLKGEVGRPLHPFMDYTDHFNKAAINFHFMFVLSGEKGRAIRADLEKAITGKNFNHEVEKLEFMPVDDRLQERLEEKGIAYPQSLRALRMAVQYLPKPEAPLFFPRRDRGKVLDGTPLRPVIQYPARDVRKKFTRMDLL